MSDLRTCGKCHTAMAESFFSKHRSKYNKTCITCLSLPAKAKPAKRSKPPKVKPPKKAAKAIEPAVMPEPAAVDLPTADIEPVKPPLSNERSDLILYISETLNQTAKATRKTVLLTILNTSASDRIKTTGEGTALPYSILSDQTLYAIKELIEADPSFTNDDLPFGS
jgi:hypothetical protein